jgi:hypothetical protein
LLSDPEVLEDITSMLLRFSDETSNEIQIKTEEIKLLLFKWKQHAKSIKGNEEEKELEEERLKNNMKREEVEKEIEKVHEVLIEEREKKEEELKKESN